MDDACRLLWAELTVRFVRSFCIDWAPFGKKPLSIIRGSGVVAVQVCFLLRQWIGNWDFGRCPLFSGCPAVQGRGGR